MVHRQGGAYMCIVYRKVDLWPLCGAKPTEPRGYLAVHRQGGAYMCVVHTKRGLWPPQESCSPRGVRGLAPASSEASRSKGCLSGPQAMRHTPRAVHTKDGAHQGRCKQRVCLVIFGGCGGWPPRRADASRSESKEEVVWESTGKALHTCVWCTQKAVCGHRMSFVI